MKKIFVFLFVSAFIFSACNDTKETTESTDTSTISTNTATDANTSTSNTGVVTDEKSKEFLTKAANSGMAEVQLAKMAQQKATIDAVKSFAAMLERDHTAVGDQVKSFASQRNVALPSAPSDDKQKMVNDMDKMSGKAFDKEFISMMVKGHNDGISLFEDTKANASDVDIKNFADKTLPTLRMHLDSAKAIQKRYW
jgi:putative membrane protein